MLKEGSFGGWRTGLLIAGALWLAAAPPARAWWAASHMVSAQIAYDRLSPGARAEAERLIAVLASAEPKADAFVPAAAWLDQVKRQGFAGFESWHFINIEPAAAAPPRMPPGENVATAIEHGLETLRRKESGDFLRALSLRLLIHLVADAHQPLHCVNRPDGRSPGGADHGGNTFAVRWPADPAANLHILWDDALGLYPQLAPGEDWRARIPQAARELQALLPPEKLPALADADPRHWVLESHRLALEAAYPGIEDGAEPSAEYLSRGREIVRQRLAIAAYRLAAALEAALGG